MSTAAPAVLDVLDRHLSARTMETLGRGGDAFHATPMDHPMAAALYAAGLAHLHVATGRPAYADAAREVADRLVAIGRGQPEGGLAWGLGFPWRHFSAEEPFAITTAVAVRALARVHADVGHPAALFASMQAGRWLERGLPWRVTPEGAAPWYSPNGPYVLPNVAGMVAAALREAAAAAGYAPPRAAASATSFVLARQDEATGLWRYGYGGVRRHGRVRPADIVDALHTAYTLEGVLSGAAGPRVAGCRSAARAGVGSLARELAARSGLLRERIVLASAEDRDAAHLVRARHIEMRSAGEQNVLLVFEQESRLAGYGAVIGMLARAQELGIAGAYWLLDRLVSRALVVHAGDVHGGFRYLPDDPSTYPRQEAHLFEGLAAYLRASTSS